MADMSHNWGDLYVGGIYLDRSGARVRVIGINDRHVTWIYVDGVETGRTNLVHFMQNYRPESPQSRPA